MTAETDNSPVIRCLYCGKDQSNPRGTRKYCDNACKTAHTRRLRQEAESSPASMWALLNSKARRLETLATEARSKADKFKPATV